MDVALLLNIARLFCFFFHIFFVWVWFGWRLVWFGFAGVWLVWFGKHKVLYADACCNWVWLPLTGLADVWL